jgi:hypothetical protein
MVSSRGAHLVAAVTLAASLSAVAEAANISIDWFGGSTDGVNNQTQMLPTETAGVVPLTNWNSFAGATGAAQPLNLDSGAASGASVGWTSNNLWDTNITEATSSNHKMMLGYLDTTDTSITNVSVTGLPASVTTGGYLVYLYYDGDNGGQTRAGRYEIGGVSQWGKDTAQTAFSGTFVQGQTLVDPTILSGGAIDNVAAAVLDTVPAGNYMIFGPFLGPDFTLNVQASVSSGGTNRASLQGLQIVQIPEPTGIALLAAAALGGLVVAARRRMRRA